MNISDPEKKTEKENEKITWDTGSLWDWSLKTHRYHLIDQ